MTTFTRIKCDIGTRFQFPDLDPDFTNMMNQLREYNLGSSSCTCSDLEDHPFRFPLLTYLKEITPKTQYSDDLHNEVREHDRQFSSGLLFRAMVVFNPPVKTLTKFGLDEKRSLIIYMALPIAEDLGLVVQLPAASYSKNQRVIADPTNFINGPLQVNFHQGDRLWYNDRLYELLEHIEGAYFGNTPISTYFTLTYNLYRPETNVLESGQTTM